MTARVLVVYTGGTLGMVPSAQGYVPATGLEDRIRSQLAGIAAVLPAYDLLELDRLIDSANLLPADWQQVGCVLQRHWADYDGFVVLHGTDTMAYTASALSYQLRGCNKPVILTGAQVPLGQPRNDAVDNLTSALILAADRRISEVCIGFRGRLLRGNRSRKVNSMAFEAFDSPNAPPLGRIGIGIDLYEDRLLPPGQPDFCTPDCDPEAVALITLFPGIPARLIDAALDSEQTRGLILQSYGVGNPPNADVAVMDALGNAIDRGVTVVNISQCHQGPVYQGAYATGAELNSLGVVPGHDLTPEAAFTKLHVLLGLDCPVDVIRETMSHPLAGDCTPIQAPGAQSS
ncbi:asparaginase [Marinobacter halodurans]|uniref:asparaginase n=1 Tax=Marinobacter halodurans TaxID=2528979 RepID=A0ABY1ZSK8_9GAMM|nr:asparaginase [Marinobacter halodurans]TBW58433.1 asparaginase [Marinobacter halodurans]